MSHRHRPGHCQWGGRHMHSKAGPTIIAFQLDALKPRFVADTEGATLLIVRYSSRKSKWKFLSIFFLSSKYF